MMVEGEATEQTWNLVEVRRPAPTEEVVAGGLDAAKPFIEQLMRPQSTSGRAGCQAGHGVPRIPSTTRTTCTPP